MPRTRAPDGCGRAREPKSRVRYPLAFDWPVATRLKPTMSLTTWPINPWSRIWNLLTKPSHGDGDLGRCSRTHGSRSSASRADGEDASTSLASSTSRAGGRFCKPEPPRELAQRPLEVVPASVTGSVCCAACYRHGSATSAGFRSTLEWLAPLIVPPLAGRIRSVRSEASSMLGDQRAGFCGR
jgi:hypothetical protein